MNENIKVCKHCGEESLAPYKVFLDGGELIEHWVCTKCYNRVEFRYDEEKIWAGRTKDLGRY